ncbi:MAG: hypothetical protein KGQ93_14900 [Cyanobacteria bacterium REEB459]|nr:hypothetical protein [Cyanobacteria bacterium REEB459]
MHWANPNPGAQHRVGYWAGAATADGLYASMAAFGLVTLAQPVMHQALWLKMGGGLALCCLGIATFRSKSVARQNSAPRLGGWPMGLAFY